MSLDNVIASVEWNVGIQPSWISVMSSDSLATVMGVGYLNGSDVTFGVTYSDNQIALVKTSDTTPVWLAIQIDGSNNINLVAPSSV